MYEIEFLLSALIEPAINLFAYLVLSDHRWLLTVGHMFVLHMPPPPPPPPMRACLRVQSRVGAVALYTVLWTVVAKYRKWRFSAPHRTKTP
jgi:hypothetical protein